MRNPTLVLSLLLFSNVLLAQHTTTSDDVKLFTKVSGKGPVCIFVHGGPGAWSLSFESLKGNRLESQMTMVYYDQRGSGRSDTSTRNDYSLSRMVEDIEDIRRSLKTKKIFLLSHSFGGILAFSYAKKYPEHVKGLILTNSTLYMTHSIEGQIKTMNRWMGTDFKVNSADSLLPVFVKARTNLGGDAYRLLSQRKEVVDTVDKIDASQQRNWKFAQRVWDADNNEYRKDFTKETPQVNLPVLIITGKKDYAIGVDHYKLFQFPNQKVVSIDAGHVSYYEKNNEFVDAVFSFVNTVNK